MREPLDLQPIKDRLAAATPGPWRTFPAKPNSPNPNDCAFGPETGRFTPDTLACIGECWAETVRGRQDRAQAHANAEFIAHAPGDVDALVAEVTSLRADNTRLVTALAAAREALTRHQNLTATDKPHEYTDALSQGCDPNGAWDCYRDVTWTIDEAGVLAQIDAALFPAATADTPAAHNAAQATRETREVRAHV